jgi:hypothetical protein
LERQAKELDLMLRHSRIRAQRLDFRYRGEALTVFSESIEAAIKEFRRGARELRIEPHDTPTTTQPPKEKP